MKKISYYFSLMVALMVATTFTACSDDDDKPSEPVVEEVTPYHFDLVVTVGKQGGMGRDVTTIMQTRDSLNGGPTVSFKNAGAEINATYSMEAIVKGQYYYQVPVSADRFTKFKFENNQVKVVQEQPFVQNTFKTRSYTHAWLNDSTLCIMAASGDTKSIVWTKLNANNMKILSEGTLSIKPLEDKWNLTTSGILAYRQSDDKLFYFYYNKTGKGMSAISEDGFHIAVINAQTMAVEQDNVTEEASEMAGSAYGELLQQTTFFDEQGNLYLAAFSDTEIGEEGKLLRISKGKFTFDAGYNGFPNADGKLLTVQYLGGGKVFTYSRNDKDKLGTGIDSYAHYYSIVDLNSKTRTRMSFNGAEIPYSSGRFSQRSAFAEKENKVYFGVNTETANPCVYIYDVATGTVAKGVDIEEGYYFEQIRLLEGEKYTIVK